MNSFLKKIGHVLNASGPLIPVLGPLIAVLAPKTVPAIQNIQDELSQIAAAVVQVEALGEAIKLQGPQKLQIVVPMIAQIVRSSPFMAGKKIKNPALFAQGVTGLSTGMVDILNSLDASSAPERVEAPAAEATSEEAQPAA